jgi:hypothetical protein
MRYRTIVAGLFIVLAAVSCKEAGEKRYHVSGEVFFDGKPIVYGDVLFTPDGSLNNSGPQGIAYIRDGKYDTSASDGKGIAGGPTVIRVQGFDKQGGKQICDYEYKVDLPRSDSPLKIEVPPEGAMKKKVGPSPEI